MKILHILFLFFTCMLTQKNNFLLGSISMFGSKAPDGLSVCNIDDARDNRKCPLKEKCLIHRSWWHLEHCYQAIDNFDIDTLNTYAPKVSLNINYLHKFTGLFPTPILTFAIRCFVREVDLNDKSSTEHGTKIIQLLLNNGSKPFVDDKSPFADDVDHEDLLFPSFPFSNLPFTKY